MRASAGTVATQGPGRVVVLDDGSRLTPLWPPVPVVDGDRVQVVIVDGVAHVAGPVVASPHPISGTISGAASGGRVPVTTTTGVVHARHTGTAPRIGTLVGIVWQGTTALLLPGTLAPVSTDPHPSPQLPAPPPPAPAAGTLPVTAAGSGTWRTGGWGWATSTDVVQGGYPYIDQDSRGGWWYGDAPRALTGRTITGLRIRLGTRTHIGSHDTTAALHLYLTTDTTRPTGDLTRIAGPTDVTLPPGARPGWYGLPAAWGQALADTGGGIGVQGTPYTGITGTTDDPESGQLHIDWTR